ncbi:hypothetical protein ACVJH7_006412 [Bradyrhizobium elkanii]
MAEMGEVHPDLMGPPGLEPAREQGGDRLAVAAGKAREHFEMGDRLAAALAHRHLLAGVRVAVDRRVDRAVGPVRDAPDERHVAALHRAGAAMVGELRGQRLVGVVVLGDHHQSRGVLVEAVHDARPLDPADAGQARAAMRDQRVDQRAAGVAGGGMHDEAPRLVDGDDVVVLEHDIERDVFALRLGGRGLRHVDYDRIALGDMISGVADDGVLDGHGTGEDQRLQPGPRQLGTALREHAVKPGRALVAGDDDLQLPTAIRRDLLRRHLQR